jgi:hypothetical protein
MIWEWGFREQVECWVEEVGDLVNLLDQHFLGELVDENVGLGNQLQVECLWVTQIHLAQFDDLAWLDPFLVQQVVRHLQAQKLLLVLDIYRLHFIYQLVDQWSSLLDFRAFAEVLAELTCQELCEVSWPWRWWLWRLRLYAAVCYHFV